jgi:1-deoxy-D-xylulose-5-phosphate reductoisomerase
MTTPKRLALFGATGTIGDNTLAVVRAHPERFHLSVLTAGSNAEKLIALAREFTPECVVISDETHYAKAREALPPSIQVLSGERGLNEAAAKEPYDCMISAMVGFSALKPTIAAIRAGRSIALANKECLVAAGELFMHECRAHNTTLLPIDSEHNGLFQLWQGIGKNSPTKVTLTASGGALRHVPLEALREVTPTQAIAHPNWKMGAKISVDSATLMNKGLELIEAQHVFALAPEQLDAIIHPESLLHCVIAFADGSQLAQMCLPDMRTPIAVALHHPEHVALPIPQLSLAEVGKLHFEAIDTARFPCMMLAHHAMQEGGCAPTILNAANEVAVAAFLQGRIRFTDIAPMIEQSLTHTPRIDLTTLDDVIEMNHLSRVLTQERIQTEAA